MAAGSLRQVHETGSSHMTTGWVVAAHPQGCVRALRFPLCWVKLAGDQATNSPNSMFVLHCMFPAKEKKRKEKITLS